MNKSIHTEFRKNIIVLTLVITIVFLVINTSLYFINNNFLVDKVEEENNAFLQITTHIMNENDIMVALEYIEHYTHIHQVDIEVMDEDGEMVFSSNVSHRYSSRYEITTLQGDFTVFIDNTGSNTVTRFETNTITINVVVLVIYVISLVILVKMNRNSSNRINKDITQIISLIHNETQSNANFSHLEFNDIYSKVKQFIENIDLLTEQKKMNMKGIAHDIKTPLTIIYSYFERINRNEEIPNKEHDIAFQSAQKINDLLNDIIEEKQRINHVSIRLKEEINTKIIEFQSVFKNKQLGIDMIGSEDIEIKWNKKDLHRVLDNIFSNGYYYSKENSKLIIEIDNKQRSISFMTTPISIETINLEELFKKGKRGANSDKLNQYGKGYGLYLCRLLLSTIDAKIDAEIMNKNVKFTIYM